MTDDQIDRLHKKQERSRERSAATIRKNRLMRWEKYEREAEQEFKRLSEDSAFMFGLGLYVGEGDKAASYRAGITNCDPNVIRAAITFLSRLHDPQKIKCEIHLPPKCSVKSAERFWARITGIPKARFGKSIRKVSKNSLGKRGNIRPNGVCKVFINSTELKKKLDRWMELALQ